MTLDNSSGEQLARQDCVNLIKLTPPCRVLLSSEPAFAGWGPSRRIRLGSGLSRHLRKIGPPDMGVGSER